MKTRRSYQFTLAAGTALNRRRHWIRQWERAKDGNDTDRALSYLRRARRCAVYANFNWLNCHLQPPIAPKIDKTLLRDPDFIDRIMEPIGFTNFVDHPLCRESATEAARIEEEIAKAEARLKTQRALVLA
jgi:hypothetical protein